MPPDLARITAEGVEAVEAIEASSVAATAANDFSAKEVASVLKGVENGSCGSAAHAAPGRSAAELQPESSAAAEKLQGALGRQAQAAGAAAASSGSVAASSSAAAAAAASSGNHAEPGSSAAPAGQGPAGQLAKLQGPAGNPLPSRRAGPATRSHSRRSMRELGLGIVEEEGKAQVTCRHVHGRK